MNATERYLAELGIQALNGSLVRLGYPPVGESLDVRMADPVVGDIPNAIVEKPGVAPFRFVFGRDLDMWIGPFSELLLLPVSEQAMGEIEEQLTQALRSEVHCHYGRTMAKVTLQLPGQVPWFTLRSWARGRVRALGPRYAPYAPPRS